MEWVVIFTPKMLYRRERDPLLSSTEANYGRNGLHGVFLSQGVLRQTMGGTVFMECFLARGYLGKLWAEQASWSVS